MASFNVADLTPDELQSLSIIRKRKAHLLEEIQQIRAEMESVSAQMEALEPVDDDVNPKAKQMLIGRKKFNMDPKRGMEYLIEQSLIPRTSQAVAEFLYKGEGLSKSAVGDYLGEKDDFHIQVLEEFLRLHDFTDLILVQALRQFLWSFRLPGESQKIDRMMEMFANRYCELNPGVFSHPDTCYLLSFAVIMLNTLLHNPSIRDKPTLDSFISMSRGTSQGADLPKELLQSLFESIRTEPFKIPEDDGNDLVHTFFNPDLEGWLWKQASSQLISGRYKSWKRRWFVLNDNCLYYFEYTTDKEPRGIIPLENVKVRQSEDKSRANTFEIYSNNSEFIKACKTEPDGRVVEGRHTVYRMSAATPEEMNMWINAIERSINNDPFFNMLQLRKKGINSARSVDQ